MSCTLGSAEAVAPRGKTFPYDARGLEIRSVEKADVGGSGGGGRERNAEHSSGV